MVVVKGSDAMTWYNDYKSKVNAQSIAGYGDQAFYDGYASLSVLKGDNYLRVAVAPAGAPPSLAAEQRATGAIVRGVTRQIGNEVDEFVTEALRNNLQIGRAHV